MSEINLKEKRKDKVYRLLKDLTLEGLELFSEDERTGYEANVIAEKLQISRNNVSKELNELVVERKAIKIKGKPVFYLAKEILEKRFSKIIDEVIFNNYGELQNILISSSYSNKLDKFENIEKEKNSINDSFGIIGEDGSLKNAVEQGKAAVMYPPRGLHTLIIGPTGVGKSTFAECMYRYSIEKGVLKEGAPFVVFNCADYSENKQLLLSQLFGYIKGAFTGADRNKDGLVEKANNGILFLDEAHRLPAEGQEMLFYLMDKGLYRKLGEVSVTNKSNVMIILATTENPQETMLQTFLRRIPMTIKIPSLSERSLEEKIEMIYKFFNTESRRINVPIKVSKEVVKAFLMYNCKGNIGQLKSDIQLICAKAFLDYMSYKKDSVNIKVSLLSANVREGLFNMNEYRNVIVKNFNILNTEDVIFNGTQEENDQKEIFFNDNKYDLDFYNIIENTWNSLSEKGLDNLKIREEIEKKIQGYSYNLINRYSYNEEETFYNQIVNISILDVVKSCIQKLNNFTFENNNKMALIISLHIQHLIERLKIGNFLKHPEKETVLNERTNELLTAKEMLKKISEIYNIEIPEDEAYYLATFLYLLYSKNNNSKVGILVIMHGESTASSMTDVANNLLNVNHAKAIDMSLNEKVQDALERAVKVVKEIDEGKGVLILGDMGSTLNFADMITEVTGIKTKVIEMTSTSIVIEATRKAMNPEVDLDYLYRNLLDLIVEILNDKYGSNLKTGRYFDNVLIDNINKTLTFLNGEKAYSVLYDVIQNICSHYNVQCDDALLVKFIFHCSCMIERAIIKDNVPYKDCQERINKNIEIYNVIKEYFEPVEEVFGINISDMEYANIMDLLEIHFNTQK